ncbi:hypothetical protein GGR53DRAFT_467003 [Hypoxylon sp. FL1150]|nr:hypothetical protein GGR53DRAFT_467003 [Hypoxylon sp. FL1150]
MALTAFAIWRSQQLIPAGKQEIEKAEDQPTVGSIGTVKCGTLHPQIQEAMGVSGGVLIEFTRFDAGWHSITGLREVMALVKKPQTTPASTRSFKTPSMTSLRLPLHSTHLLSRRVSYIDRTHPAWVMRSILTGVTIVIIDHTGYKKSTHGHADHEAEY